MEDVRHAARCGADFVGLVAAESSRRLDMAAARELARVREEFPVRVVGVFHRQSRDEILRWIEKVPLDVAQVHPEDALELPIPVLLSHRLKGPIARAPEACARYRLYEIYVEGVPGGTGMPFPVEWLGPEAMRGLCFLAGGLTPENVGDRVRALRPFGVDVSGGVELAPGVKCPDKVQRFMEEARHAWLA